MPDPASQYSYFNQSRVHIRQEQISHYADFSYTSAEGWYI
jgi:hypothetical protein